MQKTRIEVNAEGEFFTLIPDDIVAKYYLDGGEPIEWDDNDEEFVILSFA